MDFKKIETIVKEAGKIIIKGKKDKSIKSKSEYNYVTNIDIEVQEYIIKELKEIDNNCKVIAEERINESEIDNAWVIDPIDGTTNYIHNYPHYAISIGYVKSGVITYGIVYNPETEELFTAKKGEGAFLNNEKISVSNIKKLKESLLGIGFPYDRKKAQYVFNKMSSLYMECQDIKRKGSAALDLAYVACGRLDGYFELDLESWDIAAGKLLVEEAGGSVKKVIRDQGIYTVATNRNIENEIIEFIKKY